MSNLLISDAQAQAAAAPGGGGMGQILILVVFENGLPTATAEMNWIQSSRLRMDLLPLDFLRRIF